MFNWGNFKEPEYYNVFTLKIMVCVFVFFLTDLQGWRHTCVPCLLTSEVLQQICARRPVCILPRPKRYWEEPRLRAPTARKYSSVISAAMSVSRNIFEVVCGQVEIHDAKNNQQNLLTVNIRLKSQFWLSTPTVDFPWKHGTRKAEI